MAYAVIDAVVTLFSAVSKLVAPTLSVPMAVATYAPKLNSSLSLNGPTAVVVSGGYDHATFQLSGLSAGVRLSLAGADLAAGGASFVVAIAVAILCRRVVAGDPFGRVMPDVITVAGVSILVGGFVWQALSQLGSLLASQQAFHVTSGHWTNSVAGITPESAAWPKTDYSFALSFWPIGIALALFAIAIVFRYGAALQRETEGLV
jgi:hypothetical protein